MLIQFCFKNFKSFRDDTILDFSATKITESSSRLVRIGNENLLPIAAIFGANASGKSNVIEAFRYMWAYVMYSFSYGGDADDRKEIIRQQKFTPFLLDSTTRDAESSFEVYFIDAEKDGCKSYNYGFTLNRAGIVEEWLNSKAKTARKYKRIFYRNQEELDLSGLPEKAQENIRISIEKETLIVSLGAKLKIAKLKAVRNWFYGHNFANFGDPMENVFLSQITPSEFAENKAVQKKVVDFLSSFDSSIVDFRVEADSDDKERFRVYAIHPMIGGETTAIPMEEESSGTLKMFALYPLLQDTLKCGSVLLIDELNARLHPLLVRTILITFLNPEINVNHAQLIFTTHDAWQLSNQLLRRDEIWFTEKDNQGVSTLYSLVDFVDESGKRIRKDESYEKNYLLGKYGAIPKLNHFDMLREE